MAFDVILQRNLSENNRIKKTVETLYTLRGTLRDGSSIIDPEILVGGTDIAQMKECNYMTITVFGRSYFIRNIEIVNRSLILITAHVDVLSSFSGPLLANKAIIKRQENYPYWNLYLNDGSLRTYQNPKIFTRLFPNGFNNEQIILSVAGG